MSENEQNPVETPEESTENQATEAVVEETVEETPAKPELPKVEIGQTVRLHLRINDGKKERIQVYEGRIIAASGSTPATKTITVRKMTKGFGVEKIIPLAMPTLEKIEIVKEATVRRSKLYFLRNYKKRLKERVLIDKKK